MDVYQPGAVNSTLVHPPATQLRIKAQPKQWKKGFQINKIMNCCCKKALKRGQKNKKKKKKAHSLAFSINLKIF